MGNLLDNDRITELTGGNLKLDTNLQDSVTEVMGILNKKKEEEEKNKDTGDGTSKEKQSAVQTEDGSVRSANAELAEAVDLASKQTANLDLKEVVAPTKLAETAIKQMENVDMAKIIGAPINAAVTAQFDAARKMLSCIQEIGVKDNTLAVVTFNFFKNGKKAVMTVPLLTLVPINAMRIKELTYAFKLKIDTESSVNLQSGVENTVGYGNSPAPAKETVGAKKETKTESVDGDKKTEVTTKAIDAVKGAVHAESTFATSFSSKKDSRATQNSKYNVETTMDINMTIAPEDNQPAGISKMLEILNNTIDVHNPNGELIVENHRVYLMNGVAVATVMYINGDGLYAPGKVTCKKANAKDDKIRVLAMDNGDKVDLIFVEEGLYTITAEKLQSYVIVDKQPAKQEKPEKTENPAPTDTDDLKSKKGQKDAGQQE